MSHLPFHEAIVRIPSGSIADVTSLVCDSTGRFDVDEQDHIGLVKVGTFAADPGDPSSPHPFVAIQLLTDGRDWSFAFRLDSGLAFQLAARLREAAELARKGGTSCPG